jgi:D-threonine aldolase
MKRSLNKEYDIIDIDRLDSPALVVYPQLVKENIRLLTTMIDDVQRLRPHMKSHKTKEATQLMLEAGIRKFKCATIAEAELLGMHQAPDVLLAYQPTGPKLQRFIQLQQKYPATAYSCLVDNISTANEIAQAFTTHGLTAVVYIDLNVGQNRTGIAPGQEAFELYEHCTGLKGVMITGLHAYDGHIQQVNLAERTAVCDKAFALVTTMHSALIQKGYTAPIIVAGGSRTFPIHAKREKVECSPGTFVFWDKGYSDQCPEQPFRPAAMVITRVVSLPNDITICLDLGHKSVAAENEITKRVYFPEAPELKAISQSEEHLVLEARPGHSFKPGDVLYGLPMHVCPTVALYERAYTIEDGKHTGEWMITARDRKISL